MTQPKSRIGKVHLKKADLLRDLDETLSSVETELDALAKVSVSNLTALAALPRNQTNQVVRVNSLGCLFVATPVATSVADGINVINGNGAQWQRLVGSSDARWRSQTLWYIDAINGNDEALGTAGAPLKSTDEVQRRWGGPWAGLTTEVTIMIVNAPRFVTLQALRQTEEACITVEGVGTVSHTDEFTSGTSYDFTVAGNHWVNVQAAGIVDWTPYIGKRIRILSNNAVSFVAAANPEGLGVGTARIGTPTTREHTSYVPVAGDAFVIEEFSAAETLDIAVWGSSQQTPYYTNASIRLNSVYVSQGGSVSVQPCSTYSARGFGCRLIGWRGEISTENTEAYTACLIKCDRLSCGYYRGCVFMKLNASRIFSDGFKGSPVLADVLFQGVGLAVKTAAVFTWIGIFDCQTAGLAALYLDDFAKVYTHEGLCGRNNITYGVDMRKSCEIVYSQMNGDLSLTGALGDITVIDVGNFSWSDRPFYFNHGSGTTTLVAGTKDVTVKALPADCRITVTHNTFSGTPGILSAPQASRTNLGTATAKFTITSSSNADTSTVDWQWESQSSGEGGIYVH